MSPKHYPLFLFLFGLSAFFACSKNLPTADGGSATDVGTAKISGSIVTATGEIARNTQVKLLSSSYNPANSADSSVKTDTTDEGGSYVFEQVDTGTYNIEAKDLSTGFKALILSVQVEPDDTIELLADTLENTGSIKVLLYRQVDTVGGYFYIPGTSLYTQLDAQAESNGYTIIDSVPAGIIPAISYASQIDSAAPEMFAEQTEVTAGQMVTVTKQEPKAIHYSVGINDNALYAGTGSAQNGILALESSAPNNVGVGDEVRVNQRRYYISRRNSASSFAIQGGKGEAVGSFGSEALSIFRAFNSLGSALNASSSGLNASDSLHLGSADLLAGSYRLVIACYADGEDTNATAVQGWRTGPLNFIRIFTPVSDSEVGVSQRHQGKWDAAGAYALQVTADIQHQSAIGCVAEHVKIEGLQIGVVSSSAIANGIQFYEVGNGEFEVNSCIVRGILAGPTASGRGIYVFNNSGTGPIVRIWNNIIYDFPDSLDAGIQVHYANTSGIIANNTLFNCYAGIVGYLDDVVLRNNLVQGCMRGLFAWVEYNPENDYNISSSKEWNQTAIHSRELVSVNFIDTANGNFHLAPGDSIAKDGGMADPVPGLFSNDVDGQTRISPWDVGADEFSP